MHLSLVADPMPAQIPAWCEQCARAGGGSVTMWRIRELTSKEVIDE
jgi:hypothetical protein